MNKNAQNKKKNTNNNKKAKNKNKNKNNNRKQIAKIAKVERNIEKVVKNIAKSIDGANNLVGSAKLNGSYKETLMNPRDILSRIPRGAARSIVVKLISTQTLSTNASGNAAFMWFPQALNDSNGGGAAPFLWQNDTAYDGVNAETTTGYKGMMLNLRVNNGVFASARAISGHIEIVPNVSITSAKGKIFTTVSRVKTATNHISTASSFAAMYSNCQILDTVLNTGRCKVADIVKMQSIAAQWIPHEVADVLNWPAFPVTQGSMLSTIHPNENVVYGIISGLGAVTTINIKTVLNVELLPDSASSNVGLFSLIADYCHESTDPTYVLQDVYKTRPDPVQVLSMV